jgi:uracil-DNA glycosylase
VAQLLRQHIFNPARLKLSAIKAQMPVRYWANLPEARLIRPLTRQSVARAEAMISTSMEDAACSTALLGVAATCAKATRSLEALQRQVAGCRDCPLGAAATQTVFGEGPPQRG